MHIDILTLFPQMVESFFTSSIMARAVERGLVSYRIINFRDFATDSHRTCDDIPYGGGAGMVLKCEPLFAALDSIGARDKRVVFPSPSGRLFNQAYAEEQVEGGDGGQGGEHCLEGLNAETLSGRGELAHVAVGHAEGLGGLVGGHAEGFDDPCESFVYRQHHNYFYQSVKFLPKTFGRYTD